MTQCLRCTFHCLQMRIDHLIGANATSGDGLYKLCILLGLRYLFQNTRKDSGSYAQNWSWGHCVGDSLIMKSTLSSREVGRWSFHTLVVSTANTDTSTAFSLNLSTIFLVLDLSVAIFTTRWLSIWLLKVELRHVYAVMTIGLALATCYRITRGSPARTTRCAGHKYLGVHLTSW